MTHRLPESQKVSQDDDYVEIDQALKRSLQHHQFKAGGFLQQMLDRGKYGPHLTFRDYIVTELRISEVQAYRLIFAATVDDLLKRHRLKRPLNERQVRPLSRLKYSKDMVLAWSRACTQKQKSLPTYSDVQREVNRLVIPKLASVNDEGYRKYRAELEVIRAAEKRMSKMLEDGELENFRLSDDKKSIRQKVRLANTIINHGVTKGGFFTRPEIRLFATYAIWSNSLKGTSASGNSSSTGNGMGDHFKYWENYLEEPPEED